MNTSLLETLIRKARQCDELDEEAKSALWADLTVTLPILPSGQCPPTVNGTPPNAGDSSPGGSTAGALPGTTTAAVASKLGQVAAPWLIVTFGIGAVAGGAAHSAFNRSSIPSASVNRWTPPVTQFPGYQDLQPRVAPSPAASPADTTPVRSATASSANAGASGSSGEWKVDDLARERELIEMARSALARGNADGALSAVSKHAAQFPRGHLAEERDALWVQALTRAGRSEEAVAKARSYRTAHPDGLFGPAVEQSLRQISPEADAAYDKIPSATAH